MSDTSGNGDDSERNLSTVLPLVDRLRPALERGERETVNHIIEQLIALQAPLGGQWQQLAHIAAGYGELTLARKAMDLNVAAWGGSDAARFQKAGFLVQMGAWRDADTLLRTLPENFPDPAINAYCRGTAALNLGKIEEARQCLEEAVQVNPQSGLAWFSLSMPVDLSQEPELADRLIAAEHGLEHAPSSERVPYFYALGKTHADRGEHALAFAAFAHGAKLQNSAVPYDRASDRADAAKAVDGYNTERIAAIARQQSERTARTIFVSGLPRSGTTLVEQILTSHSAVGDGGEISRLLLLAGDVGGTSYPELARYVEAQGAAPAALLWDHLLDELFPGPGRIVDKTVSTSRFLGLAAALLPDAPLIWMTRDPLDRAWSCFRTNFSGSAMPWSYDLENIAAHFRLEDELLVQWREILGERLLVVPYEELASDPDVWIRRLLAHCELSEEAQVFVPHENRRSVTTASMVQVRKPINRQGIGSAEPYRTFLKPFIDAYYD